MKGDPQFIERFKQVGKDAAGWTAPLKCPSRRIETRLDAPR